ncbi:TonB-dependent receptor [Chitinophaga pendula]|nr:TonB-dependent receptor [Chitinophaga pendula]
MMRSILLLTSGILCLCIPGMSQSGVRAGTFSTDTIPAMRTTLQVNGKVVDDASGKPIEYASVVLLGADSAIIKGMYTPSDGNFRFNGIGPGTYVARVTFMGYDRLDRAVKVVAGKAVAYMGTLRLQASGKTLEAVEVKGEKPAFSMQIDRQVFDAGAMLTADGGTAADVMKNIPSVEVDIDDNISLRGKGVTIYVDGKPSPFGDARTALQMIPAESIDRVEVITNPSAKFEAQGGGGIINIVLKKDKAIGYNVMFNAGAAAPGQLSGGANANLRLKRINIFGNYNGRYGDVRGNGYSQRQNLVADTAATYFFSQDSRNRNSSQSHGGRLGFDYFLDDYNTITLSQGINRNISDNTDEILLDYRDAKYSRLRSGNRENSGDNGSWNYNTSLNFRHTTDRANEELTAYVSYSDNSGDNRSEYHTQYFRADGSQQDRPNQQQNRGISGNRFWNGQADYTTPFGKKGKFETGMKMTARTNDNDYHASLYNWDLGQYEKSLRLSNTYSYKERVYGAYANVANAIGQLGYQVGVRVEQAYLKGYSFTRDTSVNNRFFNVFPSVFLKYNLPNNQNQSLVLNYATRVDRPNFDQLLPYINNSDPQNIRTGNPELRPALTHKFELNYSRYYPKRSNFLNAGVYYSQTNGDIDRISVLDTTTGVTTTRPMNLSTDKDWGANLMYRMRVIKGWNVTANLNLEYSRLTGAANISNENFGYGLTLNSQVRLPARFSLQVNGHYRSPRVQPQGTFKAMNGVDMGIRKELLKNNALALSLNISDVFNTQQYNSHYVTPTFIQDYDRKRTTRFIRFNVRYRFGKMDPNLFKRKKHTVEEDDKEKEKEPEEAPKGQGHGRL